MAKLLFQKLKWHLILWLARRLPDCKHMTRELGESLDRKQSWRDGVVMKLHVFTCEACARYREQVAFLKTAVHAHGKRDSNAAEFSTATLSAESKERIKALLRNSVGLAF